MTTPQYPWSTTNPADLPQGVVAPSQLGGATQNHTKAKYRSQAASRFPSQVNDTMAGNPANTSGPLGIINNLAAGLQENVANADPATITKPADLLPQANPFFSGLPLQKVFQAPLRILASLIGGIPIIGDAVEDALAKFFRDTRDTADDAIETVVSVGTQVNYVQELIVVRTGRPFWETGPDRTACVSFPFGLMNLPMSTITIGGGAHDVTISGFTGYTTAGGDNHRHAGSALDASAPNHVHTVTLSTTPPSVKATATYAPWGTVIFDSAAERKVVNWIAWKSGTVSTFFIDLYRLEPDGTSTYTGYSTPDLAGALATMPAWMSHLMDGASIVADIDDAYEAQFRMTGSGDVHIAGVNMSNPIPLPGFRPYTNGSGRNPSTTPVPASLSLSARDAMYTGPTPFVGFGIDVGQTQIPRFFFDDFNRSSFGPRWIAYGPIRLRDGRFQHTESGLTITSGAAMYHQPLASDANEVAFDHWPETGSDPRFRASGVGMHCSQGLGAGVWLSADGHGVYLETGPYSYGSRTVRAQHAPVGAGRLILTYDPDDLTYRVYKGGTDVEPFLSWTDTGGIVQRGIGRRWWGLLVTGGFLAASTEGDNVTAADITTEEEP